MDVEETGIADDELALGNEMDTQPASPVGDVNETIPADTTNKSIDSEVITDTASIMESTVDDIDKETVESTNTIEVGANDVSTGDIEVTESVSNSILTEVSSATGEDTEIVADNVTALSSTSDNPVTTNGTATTTHSSPSTHPVYPDSQSIGANTMASNSTDKTSSSFGDYQIMPESSWPPPMFVKKNITPQERYYLENRWHSQWRFFDTKASNSKSQYFWLQRIVVIGSVTVPVLVSLDPDIIRGLINFIPLVTLTVDQARLLIDITTVLLSLAVAISAGLESLNKYGDNWGSYRQAAEELQAEKSFYDVDGGRYANNPDAFSRFVERTEEIIAQQNGRFIASVEKQTQESEKRGEEFLGLDEDETTQEDPVYPETSAG
ncbi:MAG: DUF4231 domain-containing protein [Anaerolineae bacterium]|nr:DUF4231 domain-containing protein [Anaerolineae bacterium]